MTHIAREQIARTPAVPAGATARTKPFLPTTRRGWLIVISIITVIVVASLGWLTNGRAGLVGVTGSSMCSVMPQGSSVITLPLQPREGDYIVALAGAPDDQSDMVRKDNGRSLIVKKYANGRLVSTDDANVYSQYEYRGRVVARIPTQKILFWRDKGAQKPSPNAPVRTVDQQIKNVQMTAAKKRWIAEFSAKTKVISPISVEGEGGDPSVLATGGSWTNPMGSDASYTATLKYDGKEAKAIAFRIVHTGPAYFHLNGKELDFHTFEELPDGRRWLIDPGKVETVEFELGACNMMSSVEDVAVYR